MEPRTLQDIVATTASLHSTRTAVTFDSGSVSGSPVSLLYNDAVALWDELSQVLQMHCFQNNGVIGLYCYADLYLPIWILGILQLPAAYVPIDPDAPGLLSTRIMDLCGLKYCVLQSDLLEQFQAAFSKLVTMEVCAVLSNQNMTLVRLQLLLPAAVPQLDGDAGLSASVTDGDAGLSASVTDVDAGLSASVTDVDAGLSASVTDGDAGLSASVTDVDAGLSASVTDVDAGLSASVTDVDAGLSASVTDGDAGLSASVTGAKDVGQGDLAYVLHTSGTTGQPKIVRVPHKCIVPNILHLRSLFQMSAEDVVFLASPLTFDPSVVEIFLALSSGARLLIVPKVIKKMPNRLAQVLFRRHSTTVLQVTPTLLGRFGHSVLNKEVLSASSPLRVLALGGEACPSLALLRGWRQEGNCTRIYNIYGITEVSCWACCYKVPESLLQSNDLMESSMPLGSPLMGTTVEVRDEQGCIITQGEGQVFIGGKDRVCLLDDEQTVVPGTMRGTGDWVQLKDEHLYYLGRRDRLVKRHGQRVHLDALQQLAASLPQVESCAVGLHGASRLVAFVVASTSGDQKAAPPPLPSMKRRASLRGPSVSAPRHQRDAAPSPVLREEPGTSDRGLQRAILHQLSLLLPAHSIPDTLVLVPALPLSSHGKVDMAALMKIYQRLREESQSLAPVGDVAILRERLWSLWQETLDLAEDAAVDEGSNFLFSGGDSLRALRLCEDVMAATGVTSAGLLEVILDGSFSDILRHVATGTLMLPCDNSWASPPEAKKRRADPLPTVLGEKESSSLQRSDSMTLHGVDVSSGNRAVKVIRRAGEVVDMKIGDLGTETNPPPDAVGQIVRGDCSERMVRHHSSAVGTGEQGVAVGNPPPVEATAVGLSLSWSSDTGRCVDASPVLLVQRTADPASGVTKTWVFIGSHSHRIQALDLLTGGLRWERVLGDRVESSAAVTQCGTLVVVGCYDGCVYFLCVESGETQWVFETGDAVKSCPAVDPLTGLVIVGSHDGHVYALDPQVQRCVWKRRCGGGAVFSSPYLHPSLRQLYMASLGGHLLCLDPDSGAVLWTYSREIPFFSSPNGSADGVVIGSVDGNICCLSHTGVLLWQFLTKGPVFSSPCVTPDRRRVLCGSHDGRVYCLNAQDGSLVWSFQTPGKVYSSPFTFDGSTLSRGGGLLVAVASTDGTVWILEGEDGALAASLTLPGELFSSPVVWERSLVVGCRDDFVYCVELAVAGDTLRDS